MKVYVLIKTRSKKEVMHNIASKNLDGVTVEEVLKNGDYNIVVTITEERGISKLWDKVGDISHIDGVEKRLVLPIS